MPAACVRRAPAKRMESSSVGGMPSSWEPEVSSWATVANGFARGDGCILEELERCENERDGVVVVWELLRGMKSGSLLWSWWTGDG